MPAPGHHLDLPRGVDITVRAATGSGTTPLSAFDTALLAAGVANFNLIPLSSVIPPHSTVRLTTEPLAGTHGDRLYCVMSSAQAAVPGDEVWAGIGWVVDAENGKGLFVEHHAATEEVLRDLIESSLADMCRNRGGGYGEVQTAVSHARCEEQPVCALVLAAYEVEGWNVDRGESDV
ncbi:pyruvoyl-dependent arginine decarboxylase [Nocardioides ferulae]|uniref:pyruvoyl-dependent arginine decarboxylase n=1 Tax=Nocardioides ferulae TaxID=2340821 RepID=UPI000EACD78D|nr:pyruvoyl-dependent arginine decarboxylase [Nocardioides ferulae]